MKGLILSAGRGTRLGRLTKRIPKPMIDVGGYPVLEHLVDYMRFYGIGPIVVNTHYLPIKIMEYFGPELLYTYEPELLGEEGTIKSLTGFFGGDYVAVMNGDTYTTLNLNRMFKMGGGKSIRYMDGNTYAGIKILSPNYFRGNKKMIDYQDAEASWYDMGTPAGLKRLRKYYAQKTQHT